jgi:hypothetical protein
LVSLPDGGRLEIQFERQFACVELAISKLTNPQNKASLFGRQDLKGSAKVPL